LAELFIVAGKCFEADEKVSIAELSKIAISLHPEARVGLHYHPWPTFLCDHDPILIVIFNQHLEA
jgi:hypothetical protein